MNYFTPLTHSISFPHFTHYINYSKKSSGRDTVAAVNMDKADDTNAPPAEAVVGWKSSQVVAAAPPMRNLHFENHALTGALGGVMVGLSTGFFGFSRIPPPRSPFPPSTPRIVQEVATTTIYTSAMGWRVFKRTLVGAILYPVILCYTNGSSVKGRAGVFQCLLAGALTGTIFGFRGGPLGVVSGGISFGVLAAVTEGMQRLRRTN